MIHFKNHKYSGFTLIEAILAVAIAGTVLTPIFILYGSIMQRVDKGFNAYNAILFGKQVLYQARQKQEMQAQTFSLENKNDVFGITAAYSLQQPVAKQSALAKLEGLHPEVVKITWTEKGQTRQENLVTFIYKNPEQKKT